MSRVYLKKLDDYNIDKLIEAVGESFDLVVIDAPPIGLVIDAAEIAKSCDGSVLVLEYNKTHRRAMAEAKKSSVPGVGLSG